MAVIVDARLVRFSYVMPGATSPAWGLRDVSLSISPGSTVGIVGESGSGKSTLMRVLCGLLRAQSGNVAFEGRDVGDWLAADPKVLRRRNQLVFQSPASSFDPRMRMRQSLAEPVKALERRRVDPAELTMWLARVGLGPEVLERFPHQLSGGQLQRVAIARALSVEPRVLYADEPTSALDVSVQAQVLNLLAELQALLGLTLVIVSHDLAVVGRMCEQIIVMEGGEIVEAGVTRDVLREPASPYTAALIAAAEAVSLRRPVG